MRNAFGTHLQDGKLSLKADEPQVELQHEDVEMKREYYHIITFPENISTFISRKKRTSEHLNEGILQQHYLTQFRTY